LTIDEKNGTIMSTMVGAGRKTVNNTFEGVLMGDIGTGADLDLVGNKSDLGIYGFHDGSQSFGFNIDGTGFIGKSGRGRILFDGNEGTISSASRTQGHVDASVKDDAATGIIMDLDDGFIDMLGGHEYSGDATKSSDWQDLAVAQYKLKLDKAVAKGTIKEDKAKSILKTAEKEYTALIAQVRNEYVEMEKAKKEKFKEYHDYVDKNDKMYHALAPLQLALIKEEITQKQYNALIAEMEYTKSECKSMLEQKLIDAEQYHKLLLKNNFIETDTYEVFVAGTTAAQAKALGQSIGGHGKLYRTALVTNEVPVLDKYGAYVFDDNGDIVTEVVNNPTQSHIRLDVQSPYFYVISDQGKRLINIGDNTSFDFAKYPYKKSGNYIGIPDETSSSLKKKWEEPYGTDLSKGYYLKSNDFTYTAFNKEDGAESEQGSGFLLDLTNGHINAFNLSIASKNVFIDSSEKADPFLIIKDNDGCNLIYAGQKDFYIQSHTYSKYALGEVEIDENNVEYTLPGFKFRTYLEKNKNTYNFLFDIRGKQQSIIYADTKDFFL
jgi:hypothetical protein